MEVESYVADNVGGSAVSSSCFGTVTHDTGCYFDAGALTAFASEDKVGTCEASNYEPVFDDSSTLTAPDSFSDCNKFSLEDDQEEDLEIESWVADEIAGAAETTAFSHQDKLRFQQEMRWALAIFDTNLTRTSTDSSCVKYNSPSVEDNQQKEHLLKADLVRYLKKIRSLSSLLKLWDLIKSADNMINRSKVSMEKDTHEDVEVIDKILEQLKQIVAPEKAARMILELINFKEDTFDITNRFVSIVTEFDKIKQENHADYLKCLTSITKTLIASMKDLKYQFCYLDFSQYSETCFASLRTYFFQHRTDVTEEMLLVMFQIGMKNLGFTVEEKNEIGNLLVDAIEAIKRCIIHIEYVMTRMRSKYLKMRSALQFFTEVYAKFPSGDKTVDQVVDMVVINDSMRLLDIIISDLWEDYISDSDNSDFEDSGASVLELHSWWSKN